MIVAENVTKRFGDITAVDGVTFTVRKGEVLGFLGPNGAGKTTTMRILTGYFPPTSGRVTVAGFDVVSHSLEVRQRIGYLPEHVPLYPEMTVEEFLDFSAAAKKIGRKCRPRAVERVIELCNLGRVKSQLIATISRGFRQRVGIAQAIINEPEVLILDEPTVGLDPGQIRDIRQLIQELGKGATVILSSHILSEVAATCSRVIILAKGCIQAMDTPERLTARLQRGNRIKIEMIGPKKTFCEVVRKIEGVRAVSSEDGDPSNEATTFLVETEPDLDLRPVLAEKVVAAGWKLLHLSLESMSLEEIFLAVTGTVSNLTSNTAETRGEGMREV